MLPTSASIITEAAIFPCSARCSSIKVKAISYASAETNPKLFCESQYSHIPLAHPPNTKMLVQQDTSCYNWHVKHLLKKKQTTKTKPNPGFKSEWCHISMALCENHLSGLSSCKMEINSVLSMFTSTLEVLTHPACPYLNTPVCTSFGTSAIPVQGWCRHLISHTCTTPISNKAKVVQHIKQQCGQLNLRGKSWQSC